MTHRSKSIMFAGIAIIGAGLLAANGAKDRVGDPYPLTTCPVTGEKLDAKGAPVVRVYDGREARFCCDSCPAQFEADSKAYWEKIDTEVIEQQKEFYPLTDCPITGSALGDMGEPVDYVFNNRLIRFCCKSCIPKFLKDPKKTLEKLDEAVVAKQKDHYPLETCVVTGEALGGEMGKPIDRVYNNRLVRFCCKGCIPDFEKNPGKFLAALDEAWKKQHGDRVGGADHDDDTADGKAHDRGH